MKNLFTKFLVLVVLFLFVGGCSSTDTVKKDAENLKKTITDVQSESGKKLRELEDKLADSSNYTKDETIAMWEDMKSEYEKSVQKIKEFKPESTEVKALQTTVAEAYQKAADSLQSSIDEAKASSDDDASDLSDKAQSTYQTILNAINTAQEALEKLITSKK